MKRPLRIRPWLPGLFAFALLAVGCQERVAEGGTETTNGTVNGVAAYEGGLPAAGARVLLRPAAYLAGMSLGDEDSISSRWEARTDAAGKFRFRALAVGRYSLEINDGTRADRMEFNVDKGIADLTLATGTLRATGRLHGTVKAFANARGLLTFVRVFGMERIAFADSLGSFTLADMPAGNYALRVNVASPDFDSLEAPDEAVSPGLIGETGELRVPFKGCHDFACDSLAVRAILDSNGKAAVAVDSVARRDPASGRILTLTLDDMLLARLPAEVGALTALKSLHAPGNRFDTLPDALLGLQGLEILYLENNTLRKLPARLGEMVSLKEIHLNTNRLTGLPGGLGALAHLTHLSAARTGLKSLPDDLPDCKALEFLELTSDSLTALPAGLGTMASLKSLYLDKNAITDLPAGIVELTGLISLTLDGNRICRPTAAVAAWLTQYTQAGAAWSSRQTCP